MKKKLLLSALTILSIVFVYKYSTQESANEKLVKKHEAFLKNHPYNKTLSLTKKERKDNGLPPNKYFEQEYLLEMNPNTGRTHPENYLKLQKELNDVRLNQRVPGDADDNKWVERGPNNVGGRTRVVMYDPNDATHKRVFAGGVSGGLWVNNNIMDPDSSWQRVGIDENLSVSCMTVDPNNSQIMYLGTGESYTGDDAVGNGVWKSTDGGTTWTNVFSDNFNADILERLYYINDIKAWNNPITNKTEVFFGAAGAYYGEGAQWVAYRKTGLFKSTNDGTSWSTATLPAIPGQSSTFEPNDIEIGADNTIWIGTERNVFGHGGGTILKSTNGSTFSIAHTIATANTRRTEIAVSKQNANTIYVLAQVRTRNAANTATIAPFLTMLKTTNGFGSVSSMSLPNDVDNGIPADDFTRGQAFYDLVIEVDPTDDKILYAGGIDLFRSANAGTNWSQISKWSNNNNLAALTVSNVHADQHAWTFHPTDANKAIVGNDGGVYYAFSLSNAAAGNSGFVPRNKNYNVTQFYHGSIGQSTSNELLLAGAQDNGTPFINGASAGVNPSVDVYGGDGAYSWIDKDGEYMIVAYVYNTNALFNLPYTGAGETLQSDSSGGSGSFINPTTLDDNKDIFYTNGTSGTSYSVYKFSDLKLATPSPRATLTDAKLTGTPTAFIVSPYTTSSSKLFVGTRNGKLLRVDNAETITPTWSDITGASFSGSVSSISFGKNESEIIVTFHNYGVTSIWFTENGGTTWTSKEGDFADIPVKASMMNPLNNDEVIIGTQLGIWRTSNFKNASPKWVQSSNGMSNVKVTSLSYRSSDNTVMATSYGRGMFTGKFAAGVASVDDVLADKKAFTMYPTVSNGNFTVFAKNTLGKSKLNIFDITGKQVYTKNLDFNIQSKQPVSVNLKSGVYIVNLIDVNNKKSTGKIIIK